MMRRILILALLLTVFYPLAAGATHADMDPNGLTAPAPETVDWLETTVRVLLSWLGI